MEARNCPDCGKLVNTERQLIDDDHPEDGECIACSQCGYCFEYLESESVRRFKRYKDESEIIDNLDMAFANLDNKKNEFLEAIDVICKDYERRKTADMKKEIQKFYNLDDFFKLLKS